MHAWLLGWILLFVDAVHAKVRGTAKVAAKRNFQLDVVVHRVMHIQCNQVCFFSACSRGETRIYQVCLLPSNSGRAEPGEVQPGKVYCKNTEVPWGHVIANSSKPFSNFRPDDRHYEETPSHEASSLDPTLSATAISELNNRLQVTKFDGVTSAGT
ncbi:unnamed protein product [Sphagnum tenellum]